MDNDTTNFETTAEEVKKEEAPQPTQTTEQKQASELLKLIDKNRQAGIGMMQQSVNSQGGREMLEGKGVENTVRSLEKGGQGALTSVEAINSLVDMLRHDLVNTIENLQRIHQAVVITNTQVGVMLEVLKDKELITEEEMTETFRRLSQQQANARK